MQKKADEDDEDDDVLEVNLVEPSIATDQSIAPPVVPRSGQSVLVEEILVRRGLLKQDYVSSELEDDEHEKEGEEEGGGLTLDCKDSNLHTYSTQFQNESVDLDQTQTSIETSQVLVDSIASQHRELENVEIIESEGPDDIGNTFQEFNIPPSQIITKHTHEMHGTSDKQLESHVKALERQLEEQKLQSSTYIKEIKKLRKQVLKLNNNVEEMEREMNAQQAELVRAAERMEKDRLQAKNDKERLTQEHATALASMIKEHKGALQALNASHSKQVADLQESMRQAEESRAKEGGNLSLELSQSIYREQDALKKVVKLTDEKSILEIQISSLTAQISALQSKVDVLNQSTENISKQEREVEDQLEATLTLHAKQMNQMQKREAELETTICQLVTELARSKHIDKASKESEGVPSTKTPSIDLETSRKLIQLQGEVETLKGQVILEEQRSKTLLHEMESISQELVQETASNMERQKEVDLLVASHAQTIAQLEKKILEYEMNHVAKGTDMSMAKSKNEEQKQILELTHELVRQQTYAGTLSAEISTLKSRLRDALDRAAAAEAAQTSSHDNNSLDHGFDMEMGSPFVKQRRRRVGMPRSHGKWKKMPWTRRGIFANDTIATIMDGIDNWIMEATSHLRSFPMARFVFLIYIVILHVWIMVLVLFHTHATVSSDGSHHGPHQLFRIHADQPSNP